MTEQLTGLERHYLDEYMKSVQNIAEVVLLLSRIHSDELIYTQLEQLYSVAQEIVDTFCIRKD